MTRLEHARVCVLAASGQSKGAEREREGGGGYLEVVQRHTGDVFGGHGGHREGEPQEDGGHGVGLELLDHGLPVEQLLEGADEERPHRHPTVDALQQH